MARVCASRSRGLARSTLVLGGFSGWVWEAEVYAMLMRMEGTRAMEEGVNEQSKLRMLWGCGL